MYFLRNVTFQGCICASSAVLMVAVWVIEASILSKLLREREVASANLFLCFSYWENWKSPRQLGSERALQKKKQKKSSSYYSSEKTQQKFLDSLYFCIGGNGVVYGIVYGTGFAMTGQPSRWSSPMSLPQFAKRVPRNSSPWKSRKQPWKKIVSALELLIWNKKSLKFHGLFQSKDLWLMTLSIANLDPPGFTLTDCFKVTSLIGSVGLLQRWEHQGWWKSQRRKEKVNTFLQSCLSF